MYLIASLDSLIVSNFFKSKNKQAYYDKFNEVIETTKDLSYSIEDQFFHPINKVVYNMFLNGEQDKIAELFKWDKKEKVKDIVILENEPYMVTPFEDKKHIRVSMAGFYEEGAFGESDYVLDFHLYGDSIDNVNDIILRDRGNTVNQYSFELERIDKHHFRLTLPLTTMREFGKGSYAIFIRYNEYQKISLIRMDYTQKMMDKKLYQFYTTINSNLGLNIK